MSLVAVSEYMEEGKGPQRDDLFNVKNNINTRTMGKTCVKCKQADIAKPEIKHIYFQL